MESTGGANAKKNGELEATRLLEARARPGCAASRLFGKGPSHPNTGADNIDLETTRVVAQQKIFHSPAYPSHVALPIIPEGEVMTNDELARFACLFHERGASPPCHPTLPTHGLRRFGPVTILQD